MSTATSRAIQTFHFLRPSFTPPPTDLVAAAGPLEVLGHAAHRGPVGREGQDELQQWGRARVASRAKRQQAWRVTPHCIPGSTAHCTKPPPPPPPPPHLDAGLAGLIQQVVLQGQGEVAWEAGRIPLCRAHRHKAGWNRGFNAACAGGPPPHQPPQRRLVVHARGGLQ